MIELLAIAAGIALMAVAWGGYQRSAERRTVATEANTIATITQNATQIYASRGDFSALTPSSALAQGVFPVAVITLNGQVANAWGGAVDLAAVSTDGGATRNGFTLTYSNVPASDCAALTMAAGSGFAEVTVRNTDAGSWTPASAVHASPAPDAIHPPGPGVPGLHDGSVLSTAQAGRVDPALVASRCANSLNSVAFTYLTAAVARTSCVGPLPPVSASQPANCPMGSNGLSQLVANAGPDQYLAAWTQTRQRNDACNASGTTNYGQWSPWAPTYACADQCVPVSNTTTPAQTYTCPGSDLITTPGASQYQRQGPQTQTTTTNQTCTTPIGPLSPPTATSTPWSPAYTCAPPCSAPATSTTPTARACPPGQIDSQSPFGTNGITDVLTRVWSCPAPTGAATYTDSTTTQNRCAPACVLPTPSTQTQCTGTPQSVACPAGMTLGAHTFQLQDTRSATCAAPTGSATWGAWTTTATRCNESDTCASPPAPSCSNPAPPSTRACPAPNTSTTQSTSWQQDSSTCAWSNPGGWSPPCPSAPPPALFTNPRTCVASIAYCSPGYNTVQRLVNGDPAIFQVDITYNGATSTASVQTNGESCAPTPSDPVETDCALPQATTTIVVGGATFLLNVNGTGHKTVAGDPPNYHYSWNWWANGSVSGGGSSSP